MSEANPIAELIENLDVDSTPLQSLIKDELVNPGSIHIVVSILAGTGLAEKFYRENVPKLLSKFGLKEEDGYTTHVTTSATTITELAQGVFAEQALKGKILIIVLSGDGGIIDLLNGLASAAQKEGYTPPCVAILPFGTANALAHSSRIASDDTFGVRTLCHGSPKPLPIFRVQFSPGARLITDEGRQLEELPISFSARPLHPLALHSTRSAGHVGNPELYGAVVCSWGFHAAIVADSDTAEFRKHGIERFKMAANEAIHPSDGGGPHQYAGEVYFQQNGRWEKIPREKHGYVLATMVSNLEEKFTISPASKPLDGTLRLVHFGPMGGDEVMRVMMQAYAGGKHVEEEAVGYEEIDGLWIDFEEGQGDEDDDNYDNGQRWRRVCVDGKIVAIPKRGWICMRKDPTVVMEILVPAA